MDDDTHFLDVADLTGYHLFGQTVFGNAIAQHSATLGFHLEYLDGKSFA